MFEYSMSLSIQTSHQYLMFEYLIFKQCAREIALEAIHKCSDTSYLWGPQPS